MRYLCCIRKAWVVILGLILLFSANVFAEEDTDTEEGALEGDTVIYEKKTVYNFDDDTITGVLLRPDQEFLSARKMSRYKSLIRIREDFTEKVLQSANDL
jgi:hypothetical protein